MADRQAVLEGLRDDLVERLERYRAHKERRGGPLDKDIEEQSIEVQNDEVIDSLENEAERELRQVMHALERLAEDAGESCEVCEGPIAPERLEALPYTTLCRDCAEART